MFNKELFILFLLSCVSLSCGAQDCAISIDGYITDQSTKTPLGFVNIYLQETQNGTTTEEDGSFVLENICPGEYHFIVSHIGCEDERFHYHITQDTSLLIELSHTPTSLETIIVAGETGDLINYSNVGVKRDFIEDNSNESISSILENQSGVSLIKNGNSISKPVVQGLYGNRLLILNNGVVQSGQQWGIDHSPEIDPFSADKISVIKGASVIEYGGGNLGSVILTEPKKIENEPHLHGQVNYIYETNGRGHTVNTRLEKYSQSLAWRVSGSLKKYGDGKTGEYFLNNTGVEEANLSLQLEKSFSDNLYVNLYASTFNSTIGILRGSQIGNTSDLARAFSQEEPFFTETDFSYDIDPPRQSVSHHLVKGEAKYFIDDSRFIDLVVAGQLNDRKEFDVRRGNRSDTPELSLRQSTFDTNLKYTQVFDQGWELKIGNQNTITDNDNLPGTGTLPLIPTYNSWKSGLFATLNRQINNISFNAGLRYDFEQQNAITITNALDLVRFSRTFNNLSGLFSIKAVLTDNQTIDYNLGYATRNPAINELYSNGLHQGVSSIEEGDPNLATERALKNTLEYKWVPSSEFSLNILAYHQHFNNYIFLNPEDELRLTIRGAFPVFKYSQTNANIFGVDITSQFTIKHTILGVIKYSYLKGQDINIDAPLIFMPPNSVFASLTYRAKKPMTVGGKLRLENSEVELNSRLVFEQINYLDGQDFIPPPPGYNLVGAKISTNLTFPKYKIRLFFKGENLLNISYRNYLNRLRYFADDLGISITGGINIKF